ncbi:MAG: SGNH/GDSL hydrolase family protein [Verrucomicrobiaceae bacterium]|nr:SGNH/GDSL hydrolase family protein [Verrucomicrobiaceae bacterium]
MKAISLLFILGLSAPLLAEPPVQPGEKLLFLGDSITQGGTYVALIDAAIIAHAADKHYDIVSAGLSSETVSGLSEPGHAGGKFPRPDLHERLDRVLAVVKPKVAVACYGMNCGIYMPLSEERFKAYRDGMIKLREKAMAAGAKVIHLTPPVHDPVPIMDKTDPTGAEGDKFTKPYTRYNDVLDKYSEWLLQQRNAGWEVIDLHGPMKQALKEGREKDPKFVLSKDGVHPGLEGHALMAQCVLDAWQIPGKAIDIATNPQLAAFWKAVEAKQSVLKAAWLSKAGHKRPGVPTGLPIEEAEAKAKLEDTKARELVRK